MLGGPPLVLGGAQATGVHKALCTQVTPIWIILIKLERVLLQ